MNEHQTGNDHHCHKLSHSRQVIVTERWSTPVFGRDAQFPASGSGSEVVAPRRRSSVAPRLSPCQHSSTRTRTGFTWWTLEQFIWWQHQGSEMRTSKQNLLTAGARRWTQPDKNVTKKVKGVFGARWCFRSKLEWFSSETFSPNKTPVQIWTWDLRQKCDRNRVDCQEMKQWSEGEDLRWGSPSWWDSPRFDLWGASSAPPSGAPPTPPTRTSGAPMRSLARMEATIGIWAG